MVYNSYKVTFTDIKQYMHKSYVNGKYRWTKKPSATLNMLVKRKGGKRLPAQQYESSKGVAIETKENTGGFKGY